MDISKKFQHGFTLIEMLVVIAIISILIGIGVNTFTIAQKKARDVRRKADLRSIQTALELYKQDNGIYPYAMNCVPPDQPTRYCYHSSNDTGYIVGLEPNYIPKLPIDPKTPNTSPPYSGSNNYSYMYGNANVSPGGYDLMARLENGQDPDACANQSTPYTYATGSNRWCVISEGLNEGTTLTEAGPHYGGYLYVLHGN